MIADTNKDASWGVLAHRSPNRNTFRLGFDLKNDRIGSSAERPYRTHGFPRRGESRRSLPPDLDLSQATSSNITKVAEYDARLFHINFDTPSTKVPDTDVIGYAEGRAIKHDLTDSGKRSSYTSAFSNVLTQLRMDAE
jgi:hypothetical protein